MRRVPSRLILVVEDDPCIQSTLVETFQDGGFACLGAGTLETALRSVQVHAPDLVVCDFHLPDGTADQLLRFMDDRPWASPMVVHSAADSETLRDAASHPLVKAVLAKPASPPDLLRAARRCLPDSAPPRNRARSPMGDSERRILLGMAGIPAAPQRASPP
jgi:CheY-like chemotaxis protein